MSYTVRQLTNLVWDLEQLAKSHQGLYTIENTGDQPHVAAVTLNQSGRSLASMCRFLTAQIQNIAVAQSATEETASLMERVSTIQNSRGNVAGLAQRFERGASIAASEYKGTVSFLAGREVVEEYPSPVVWRSTIFVPERTAAASASALEESPPSKPTLSEADRLAKLEARKFEESIPQLKSEITTTFTAIRENGNSFFKSEVKSAEAAFGLYLDKIDAIQASIEERHRKKKLTESVYQTCNLWLATAMRSLAHEAQKSLPKNGESPTLRVKTETLLKRSDALAPKLKERALEEARRKGTIAHNELKS